MKMIKKNQVMVGVIALLLITVGYLNYNGKWEANDVIETSKWMDAEEYASLGDATLVSSSAIEETNSTVENVVTEEEPLVETTTQAVDYFQQSRLERENMYSQSLSSYQNLLENTQISAEQKQIAQEEIKRIQQEKNAIMITENLIKTKGIEDVIVFKNQQSVNVIIKKAEPTEEEIAQVQNIVTREMQVDLENMHISAKS